MCPHRWGRGRGWFYTYETVETKFPRGLAQDYGALSSHPTAEHFCAIVYIPSILTGKILKVSRSVGHIASLARLLYLL
jgi:hypothetical protein